MQEIENPDSFFTENKKLVKHYLETRLEIYRLLAIQAFSKSAGYLIWVVVFLLLIFLLTVFIGIATGFWLSWLTGSYTKGFGLTAMLITVVVVIVGLLRKTLFVNPIIRNIINHATEVTDRKDEA